MGPRKFARWFTKYLLHHGQLAKQCRMYEDQRLLELQSSDIQSDGILSLLLSLYNKSTYHVHNIQFDTNHVAMLLIATFVIASHKKKDKDQKRKHRVYNSTQQQKSSSKNMDTITLVLANVSLYLIAMLFISSIVGDSLVELKELHAIDKVVATISERVGMSSNKINMSVSVSEEMWIPISRQLLENYLSVISLCSILMSIILTVIGFVWSLLDPRNITATSNVETKQKKTWQRMVSTMAWNVAISISVEVVLALAYIYLPFIGKIVHGDIEFGLSQGLVQFLDRVISSFIGYCIFSKLLPRPEEAVQVADGVRKTKKYAVNPEMVKRMSSLANEARERVEARNRRGTKQLRRNFQKSYSPTTPTRHRPSLTALPEATSPDKEQAEWKKWMDESPKTPTTPTKKYVEKYPAHSPLRDIHLAGPTLSSSALLAKRKNNKSLARSGSTGCFVALPDLTRNISDEST